MGLRCIIGHDYGEPDRTETREDRGDERVVTVREYRECRRCGHQQVISENTEVRPNEDPAPEGESEATVDTTETPETVERAGTAEEDYEDVTAEEDDGVILDDENDAEAERDHDEWPDDHREKTAEATEDEHGEWPESDAEDEGFDAESPPEAPEEGVDFEGGLTPEGSSEPLGDADRSDPTAEATSGSTGAEGVESGIRRSDPGPSPTTQQRSADPDTVFVCPNCETTAPAHDSSLRPGDICPECGRGYLTEREDT